MTSRSTPAVLYRIFCRQHALLRQVMRVYFDSFTKRIHQEIRFLERERQRWQSHAGLPHGPQHKTFAAASRANIHKLTEQLHDAHHQPLSGHVAYNTHRFDSFDTPLELVSDDPRMIQQVLALDRMSPAR